MAHRWVIFLSLDNNATTTKKYIKKVIYHLHPAYKDNRVELPEHAYMLSRTAFGAFVIGCEIIFQEWTNLQPLRIDHLLNFVKQGKVYQRFINVYKSSEDSAAEDQYAV
jgi:YEATS domain-contaning protein 2